MSENIVMVLLLVVVVVRKWQGRRMVIKGARIDTLTSKRGVADWGGHNTKAVRPTTLR